MFHDYIMNAFLGFDYIGICSLFDTLYYYKLSVSMRLDMVGDNGILHALVTFGLMTCNPL